MRLFLALALVAAAHAQTSVVGEGGGGASDLDALTDVTLTSPAADELVRYNGSAWVNSADRVSTFAPVGANGDNIYIGGGGTAANGTGTQSSQNTAVGFDALSALTTGRINVAVGSNAGKAITGALRNTLVGQDAGHDMTTGSYNTAIGWNAGAGTITGARNVFIGDNARSGVAGGATSYEIVIGADAVGLGTGIGTYGHPTVMTRHVFQSGQVEADDLMVYDDTATTGSTLAKIKAGAGQSTDDLMQWQDNAGNVLGKITSDGYGALPAVQLVDPGSKPACSSDTRGMIWYDAGGAGVADTAEICGKDASDVYAWVAIATF